MKDNRRITVLLAVISLFVILVTAAFAEDAAEAFEWPNVEFTPEFINLTKLKDTDSRRQAKGGPDEGYIDVGAFKPYKVNVATGWFVEGDYVLTDIDYPTVGRRCVYFPTRWFDSVRGVEKVTFNGISGEIGYDVTPYYGPGYEYDRFVLENKETMITGGTSIEVLTEKDDWLFIEWFCPQGAVRLWVPADAVTAD
ncbi:MAG: hypothetical protein MJ142_07405 [Clostridia bacterium]|nr:hypothetical protein [Clostridia bacterium]